MKNPYIVLGLTQDADEAQIARAQISAMHNGRFSISEISSAQASLRRPKERLMADFTYNEKMTETVTPLYVSHTVKKPDLTDLDDDKYDSLK